MSLALDYMGKMIIIIVVIGVVIGLMLTFSADMRDAVASFFFPEQPGNVETEVIERTSFSLSQMKNYIVSCWTKTGEDYNDDAVCYLLIGDVSGVDQDDIEDITGDSGIENVTATDFDNALTNTIIEFKDIGNKITVRSS